MHTSACTLPDLSSRLKLTAEDTLRLLTELEARGAVQLSGDQGEGSRPHRRHHQGQAAAVRLSGAGFKVRRSLPL